MTTSFTGNLTEQGGYLGAPMLVMVALFAMSHGRQVVGRFLLILFGTIVVASLGPVLRFAGMDTIPLPWSLMRHLPLLRYALPSRVVVYAFLVLAVMVALWVNATKVSPTTRTVLSVLIVVFLLPNPAFPATSLDVPAFFATSIHRQHLREGETVVVIPYGNEGGSMLWQAQTGMYFRMAGGYLGVVRPPSFTRWPIVGAFYSGQLIPNHGPELKGFLAAHDVSAIVVDPRAPGPWDELFAPLEVRPVEAGGVLIYRVPSGVGSG